MVRRRAGHCGVGRGTGECGADEWAGGRRRAERADRPADGVPDRAGRDRRPDAEPVLATGRGGVADGVPGAGGQQRGPARAARPVGQRQGELVEPDRGSLRRRDAAVAAAGVLAGPDLERRPGVRLEPAGAVRARPAGEVRLAGEVDRALGVRAAGAAAGHGADHSDRCPLPADRRQQARAAGPGGLAGPGLTAPARRDRSCRRQQRGLPRRRRDRVRGVRRGRTVGAAVRHRRAADHRTAAARLHQLRTARPGPRRQPDLAAARPRRGPARRPDQALPTHRTPDRRRPDAELPGRLHRLHVRGRVVVHPGGGGQRTATAGAIAAAAAGAAGVRPAVRRRAAGAQRPAVCHRARHQRGQRERQAGRRLGARPGEHDVPRPGRVRDVRRDVVAPQRAERDRRTARERQLQRAADARPVQQVHRQPGTAEADRAARDHLRRRQPAGRRQRHVLADHARADHVLQLVRRRGLRRPPRAARLGRTRSRPVRLAGRRRARPAGGAHRARRPLGAADRDRPAVADGEGHPAEARGVRRRPRGELRRLAAVVGAGSGRDHRDDAAGRAASGRRHGQPAHHRLADLRPVHAGRDRRGGDAGTRASRTTGSATCSSKGCRRPLLPAPSPGWCCGQPTSGPGRSRRRTSC